MSKNSAHDATSTPAQVHATVHRTATLLSACRYQISYAPIAQTRWHQQQQAHFLAWLDAGGFAQTEPAKENSGIAPLFSAPQRDLHEES